MDFFERRMFTREVSLAIVISVALVSGLVRLWQNYRYGCLKGTSIYRNEDPRAYWRAMIIFGLILGGMVIFLWGDALVIIQQAYPGTQHSDGSLPSVPPSGIP